MDIFGNALLDYWHGREFEDLTTYSSLEEEDRIPLDYLFRSHKQMPTLEQKALSLCRGKVLDIGCGAGIHAMYLQEKGVDVTAIDISPGAAEVCRLRGLKKVYCQDFRLALPETYDSLLLLMNGTGLAGNLKGLGPFMERLKSLLTVQGQILIEGTDILYMFESDEQDGGHWVPENTDYYGEVSFEMVYKGKKSERFPWLYLDFNTLARAANYHGMSCEMAYEGPSDNYLAILQRL